MHFPEAKDGGPIINPCNEEPSDHFTFHYDSVAKLASVYGVTSRGSATEILLGLNRPALREFRSKYINALLVLAVMAATDSDAAAFLQEAKQACSQYTAFARALL